MAGARPGEPTGEPTGGPTGGPTERNLSFGNLFMVDGQPREDEYRSMIETLGLTTPREPALSILLVDDDAMVREATAWMLADAGHSVHEAADGVAALDFLVSGRTVDLLITDINMPRMDGLELVQQTKERWPALPVLLVSARPQPPGTQAFMPKPFGWDTLMKAVAGVRQAPAAPHL